MRRHALIVAGFLAACFTLACTPDAPQLAAEGVQSAELAGDTEDGSPAPPSGCWAERSCGKPTLLCKHPDDPKPCGAPGCTDWQFACTGDAACPEGYACNVCKPGDPPPCGIIPGRCHPRGCARDSDCGSPNVVCQASTCTHRTCRTSRSCKGYCVSGACWAQPGWCFDTTLPPPP